MDTTIIDHERRLTRLEDHFQINQEGIKARLDKADAVAAKVETMTDGMARLGERIADLARRLDELETASPAGSVSAGTIGLAPKG